MSIISSISFFIANDASFGLIKVLRSFRVIRILRVVKRADGKCDFDDDSKVNGETGLRVVFVSFVQSLSRLGPLVIFVTMSFWIFGLVGNAFFQGGFRSCNDPSRFCFSGINGVDVYNSTNTVAGNRCTAEFDCIGTFVDPKN